eukprot:4835-Heterococcus_DN1.PRE.2
MLQHRALPSLSRKSGKTSGALGCCALAAQITLKAASSPTLAAWCSGYSPVWLFLCRTSAPPCSRACSVLQQQLSIANMRAVHSSPLWFKQVTSGLAPAASRRATLGATSLCISSVSECSREPDTGVHCSAWQPSPGSGGRTAAHSSAEA